MIDYCNKQNKIFENTKNQMDKQNKTLQNIIKDTTMIKSIAENAESSEQKSNFVTTVNFAEKNNNQIPNIKDEHSEVKQKVEIFNNEIQENNINVKKAENKTFTEEKNPKINPLAEILEANDIIAEINLRVESFNAQMNSTKNITESNVNKTEYENPKLKLTTAEAEEIIRTLVNSHLYETEKIIDKVMKKNQVSEEENNQKLTVEEKQKNETILIQLNNVNEVSKKDIKREAMLFSEIETQKEKNANTDTNIMEESKLASINNMQENQNTALVINENSEAIFVPENIFKRIWRKFLKLFKFKITVEKTED